MKTSLNWKPTPASSPCWYKGEECIHKHEDYGRCRNNCKSYAEYTELKSTSDAKKYLNKHNNMLLDSCKIEGIKRMRRRIG